MIVKRVSIVLFMVFVLWSLSASGQTSYPVYKKITDIPCYDKTTMTTSAPVNAYRDERCKLDLYYPEKSQGFSTLIWFHGGGLYEFEKKLPGPLQQRGLAVVTPNYRLSSNKARCPDYIEDAAAATAWTLKNIEKYGGDPKRVFICGGSAGGYLCAMVGMDGHWLGKFGCSNRHLTGIIPMIAQVSRHFQINKEQKISASRVVIDRYAPISHISKDLPPILLVVGDRDLDRPARVEENYFLAALLKRVAGHEATEIIEIKGRS